jgi:hypothetical protein
MGGKSGTQCGWSGPLTLRICMVSAQLRQRRPLLDLCLASLHCRLLHEALRRAANRAVDGRAALPGCASTCFNVRVRCMWAGRYKVGGGTGVCLFGICLK